MDKRIYVASRTKRAEMWKQYRSAGAPIISTWIDEAGPNETGDMTELWKKITREILLCTELVLYATKEDFPWKSALVEIGMTIMCNYPVKIICNDLPGRTALLGSWIYHPLVSFHTSLDQVFGLNCGY